MLGGWHVGQLSPFCNTTVHRSSTGNRGGESGLNVFVNDPTLVQLIRLPSTKPSALQDLAIEDIAKNLRRLKQLRDQGLVSNEEFEKLN